LLLTALCQESAPLSRRDGSQQLICHCALRVSKRNLSELKARKLKGGMPYKTLINSILRKAVS
jgi:hypothetical protein